MKKGNNFNDPEFQKVAMSAYLGAKDEIKAEELLKQEKGEEPVVIEKYTTLVCIYKKILLLFGGSKKDK